MPDIAAPYFSATELTQMPGDAALSGVQANFDPSNKAPLGGLQSTFDRVDAENKQAQRQKEVQQHDILMRNMQYDHEEKVKKYEESLGARKELYNMFNKTGATAASLKDDQGNDMSIPFLPEDNSILSQEAGDFQKWAMSDPGKNLYSPELAQKMGEMKQKRNNASLRTIYYKQAEQALQNTYDPKEKERLQDYMQSIKKEPLASDKLPHPFVALPTVKPLIDVEKEYKDGKGYEDFGEGTGVPNSRYLGLGSTTDPRMIDEGFKRYQFFQSQPEGQSAAAYSAWKEKLDQITESRGLPPIDLGATPTQDGRVTFDDGTYAKKQQLARKMLAATELMNNGYLKQPDEEDVLNIQKKKAEIEKEEAATQKDRIEALIKQKELQTGKSAKPTTEELKQQQTVKSVKSMYKDVKKTFDVSKVKPIGMASGWWKKNGIDPDQYKLYPTTKGDAERYIGIEDAEQTVKTTKNGVETSEKVKGASAKADNAYIVEDKNTGQKELVYIKGNKVLARVPEKEAVMNGLKHEAKYDPARYEDKTAWVEDVYNEAGKDTEAGSDDEAVIRARLVPITLRRKDGSIVKAKKDPVTGKRYADE